MKIGCYEHQKSRHEKINVLVLSMTSDEKQKFEQYMGSNRHTVIYDRGTVVVQSTIKDNVPAAQLRTNGKSLYVLQQPRSYAQRNPEPFGLTEVPPERMDWDKGILIMDVAGLQLNEVAPRKPQVRKRQRLLTHEPNKASEMTSQPITINGSATEVHTPVPAVDQSEKLRRKVYDLLSDYFDEQNGFYRDGYSDDRIAKETGASVDFVAKMRRGGWGELKEDPKIAEIRGEIAKVRKSWDTIHKHYESKLEMLEAKLQNLILAQKYR